MRLDIVQGLPMRGKAGKSPTFIVGGNTDVWEAFKLLLQVWILSVLVVNESWVPERNPGLLDVNLLSMELVLVLMMEFFLQTLRQWGRFCITVSVAAW